MENSKNEMSKHIILSELLSLKISDNAMKNTCSMELINKMRAT
jgi:hypothetical protein